MGANAQTSVYTFTAGQILTAAQMNDTARTGVPVFATTTTRDAAFGGTGEKTLAEGQMCYIEAAPKRFQVYNGTTWLDYDTTAQTFTPTWTNYTRGNGTTEASYIRLGSMVFVFIQETLGTTSSVTGSLAVALPIARATASKLFGVCFVRDPGFNFYTMQVDNTGTNIDIYASNASTTYVSYAGTSATVPMTWGSTDQIKLSLVYDVS